VLVEQIHQAAVWFGLVKNVDRCRFWRGRRCQTGVWAGASPSAMMDAVGGACDVQRRG